MHVDRYTTPAGERRERPVECRKCQAVTWTISAVCEACWEREQPDDPCSIVMCDRPRKTRGWCEMHYYRWYRNGTPHYPTDAEAIWSQIERTESGCWEWTGRRSEANYPQYGKHWAHRYVYELLVEPIPEGLELDHLCVNPPCVNPAHLEPVTHAENVKRAWEKNRSTHCPQGHEFTEENTYRSPTAGSSRACRECSRIRQREARRRRNQGHPDECQCGEDGDGVPICSGQATAGSFT